MKQTDNSILSFDPLDAVGEGEVEGSDGVVKVDRLAVLRCDVGVDDLLLFVVVLDVEVEMRPQQHFVTVRQEAAFFQMADEASHRDVVDDKLEVV